MANPSPVSVQPNSGWVHQNNGPMILAVAGTMTTLGLLFAIARIYSRLISIKKLGIDDYIVMVTPVFTITHLSLIAVAVSFGAGRHLATLSPKEIHYAILLTMTSSTPLLLCFTVPKYAVLILLAKVLNPGQCHKIFMWANGILYSLFSISCVVIIWAQCTPVAVQWGGAKGTCWSPVVIYVFGLAQGIWSALFDLYMAMYPSIVLATMRRLNPKKKLALSSALGFGYCAAAVTAYKCYTLSGLLGLRDFTYAIDDLVLWSTIEGNCVLIGACIPTLYPLVTKVFGVRALRGGTPNAKQGASILTIGRMRGKVPLDLDRLNTLDDSTGEVYSITLVEEVLQGDSAKHWAEEATAQLQERQLQVERGWLGQTRTLTQDLGTTVE